MTGGGIASEPRHGKGSENGPAAPPSVREYLR